MRLLQWLSRRPSAAGLVPTWGIGFLVLSPVLSFGADEQGPIPRSIVGGEATTVQRYPFALYLQMPAGGCTGSLIAPNWVLTAAHCAVSTDGPIARIHVWHRDLVNNRNTYRSAKQFISHPGYRFDLKHLRFRPDDIALIELSQPFPEEYAAPLDILSLSAEQKYAPSGTSSTLLGYGRMDNKQWGGGLRSLTVPLYHAADCRKRINLSTMYELEVVHGNTVCVGSSEKHADLGDSGGPLIIPYSGEGNTQWLQVGVANRHVQGDLPLPVASSYARVAQYADWIKKSTKGAVVPITVQSTPEQLTNRLKQIQVELGTMRQVVQSLRSNRNRLAQLVSQLRAAEKQANGLQADEDGVHTSISTLLTQ